MLLTPLYYILFFKLIYFRILTLLNFRTFNDLDLDVCSAKCGFNILLVLIFSNMNTIIISLAISLCRTFFIPCIRAPPIFVSNQEIEIGGKTMNDYNRKDFLVVNDNETGNKVFYIRINNKMIEVTKDVYSVCYNSYRKQIRDGKRDQKYNLISYDMILDNQLSLLETFVLKEDDALDSILLKDDYMKVIDIINRLDYKDKNLIIELLFHDKKEKELAQKYQIAQQAINKKKLRIIKKIKENFKK